VAMGEIIGGYRLRNLMGTGQISQVYEVVEMASGRHMAMKILLPEHVKNPHHRQFLFHEAEVGLKLRHPNVIKIEKVVKQPTEAYFIMEFFPAGSLKGRLTRKETDFIRDKAQEIFKQWATALAYMNGSGWIHRDVKPDNVLVNSAGETKLIDFAIAYQPPKGLAKLFRRKGKPQGTRSYMAPEQILDQVLDTRADIYAFGASLYEVLTGRPPFRGTTSQDLLNKHLAEKPVPPTSLNAEVTPDFSNLVMAMLAKKREDRPNNFHEVLIEMRKMRVFKKVAKKES
jgi:eukaryotic-like serine/threonine-protein kinase